MITTLHIKNIGIIDDLTIDLNEGLNVLTGETGAGKTLIIDSLAIIAGGRFSKEMIRRGENYSFVELSIYYPDNELAIDGNIIVTREVYANGRNSCKINGRLVTVNELKDILHYIYFQYNNRSNYWFNEEEKIKLDHFFNENIYNGQNEELYNLYHYMLDYQPDRASISDWGAKSNWGVVNRNGEEWLVIIDDGFDEEVSSKYYRR